MTDRSTTSSLAPLPNIPGLGFSARRATVPLPRTARHRTGPLEVDWEFLYSPPMGPQQKRCVTRVGDDAEVCVAVS